MEFRKLEFDFSNDGTFNFESEDNYYQVLKYLAPILHKNREWWPYSDFDIDQYRVDPRSFDDIVAMTVAKENYVMCQNDRPGGYISYNTTDYNGNSSLSKTLRAIVEDSTVQQWKDIWNYAGIKSTKKKTKYIVEELKKKPYYYNIGILLRTDIQRMKTGLADRAMKILSDGYVVGSTSNPLIVRLRRKVFRHTQFYPLIGRKLRSRKALAAHLLVCADIYRHDLSQSKDYSFGVRTHEYFEERGREYLKIADSLHNSGRISDKDLHRLNYIIDNPRTAGTIVSYN